jgi:galactokinase
LAAEAVVRSEARSFRDLFGHEPEVSARAPGRVNLIGEHTDYNGGYVLPTAIPQETRVELRARGDRRVRAFSAEMSEEAALGEYEIGEEEAGKGWIDYVQGVTQAALRSGHAIGGFDLRVTSAVPVGSGLSSSAALEVSLLRALRTAFGLTMSDVDIALLGQRAENELVGAPVGVMDQMASSLASEGTALFLDTRSLEVKRVPIPESAEIVVISSGVAHSHASGDYRTRRAECERAAALLGVSSLRDLGPQDLARAAALPEPLGRRVRHVVTENERVLEAVTSMHEGDVARLGGLFRASHKSMRDDYEVSIPEIDMLVDIAESDRALVGARLTGGGFGGSVVMLARRGLGAIAAARVAAAYAERSGRRPAVLVPPGAQGGA